MVAASFTDYDQRSLFTGDYGIVGVAGYVEVLTDVEFWTALVRTVGFTAVLVVSSVLIGAAVAQLLTKLGSAVRIVVTVVLVFAWAMPNVAASLVWNWMFQPGYGVLNWVITQLRVFGDFTNTNWADNPALAFTAIWLLIVWQAVPFIALTLYAAQTQIPGEYLEAARLDGADEARVYRTIVLPFLRPTIVLIAILSTIWDFNVFNQIWLVSQGGPDGATSTLGVFTYLKAFVGFDIGTGAAIAVLTTIVLGLLTSLYVRTLLTQGEDL